MITSLFDHRGCPGKASRTETGLVSRGKQVPVPGAPGAVPYPHPGAQGWHMRDVPKGHMSPGDGDMSRVGAPLPEPSEPPSLTASLPHSLPEAPPASRSDPPAAAAAAPRGPRPSSMARGRNAASPPRWGQAHGGGQLLGARPSIPSRVYLGRARLFPSAREGGERSCGQAFSERGLPVPALEPGPAGPAQGPGGPETTPPPFYTSFRHKLHEGLPKCFAD